MPSTILTRCGYEKLRQELEHLREIRRPEIALHLKDAHEGGDFIDDMDGVYLTAVQEQAFIEGRIAALEKLLANPRVVEDHVLSGVVEIGSTVTISEDGNPAEVYTIVGPAESNPSEGRISYESSLGKALLGHCPEDLVTVKAPGGSFTVRILCVE